jgi:uncharacterized membrane protein YkvA (DUF1232 family)
MTDRTKKKLIILGIVIYWLFPDIFPGPIDDLIITAIGLMYNKNSLTD